MNSISYQQFCSYVEELENPETTNQLTIQADFQRSQDSCPFEQHFGLYAAVVAVSFLLMGVLVDVLAQKDLLPHFRAQLGMLTFLTATILTSLLLFAGSIFVLDANKVTYYSSLTPPEKIELFHIMEQRLEIQIERCRKPLIIHYIEKYLWLAPICAFPIITYIAKIMEWGNKDIIVNSMLITGFSAWVLLWLFSKYMTPKISVRSIKKNKSEISNLKGSLKSLRKAKGLAVSTNRKSLREKKNQILKKFIEDNVTSIKTFSSAEKKYLEVFLQFNEFNEFKTYLGDDSLETFKGELNDLKLRFREIITEKKQAEEQQLAKEREKLAKEQEFVSLVKDTLSLTRAGLISEAFFVDNKSQNDSELVKGSILKTAMQKSDCNCYVYVCLFTKFENSDYEEFYIEDPEVRLANEQIFKLLIVDQDYTFEECVQKFEKSLRIKE